LANKSITFPHLGIAGQRVLSVVTLVSGGECIAYLGLGVGPKEDSLESFHDYECHWVSKSAVDGLRVIQPVGGNGEWCNQESG
jgi:hypothetical protein